MAEKGRRPADSRPSDSLVWPALKVGALSGTCGVLVGGTAGLVKSTTPALFAAASGIQWFGLGTTYWGARSFILQAWDTGSLTPNDRRSASTIAGGVAGSGIALLTRGPRNVIPGCIMFSLFGYGGQTLYNRLDAQNSAQVATPEADQSNWLKRVAGSKWSPMTVLTDEDYENMLKEKILKLDVEIAMVDDRIADLRVKEASQLAQPAQPPQIKDE